MHHLLYTRGADVINQWLLIMLWSHGGVIYDQLLFYSTKY